MAIMSEKPASYLRISLEVLSIFHEYKYNAQCLHVADNSHKVRHPTVQVPESLLCAMGNTQRNGINYGKAPSRNRRN